MLQSQNRPSLQPVKGYLAIRVTKYVRIPFLRRGPAQAQETRCQLLLAFIWGFRSERSPPSHSLDTKCGDNARTRVGQDFQGIDPRAPKLDCVLRLVKFFILHTLINCIRSLNFSIIYDIL